MFAALCSKLQCAESLPNAAAFLYRITAIMLLIMMLLNYIHDVFELPQVIGYPTRTCRWCTIRVSLA